MDRERLKDVQKSELANDRLNEDFLTWIKTKGPSWLLVILIAIVAYLFIVNWKQKQVNYRNEAWLALMEAQLPASLEDVALQYPDVDSVAQQARLRAANMYLQSVLIGEAIGSTPDQPLPLSDEDRQFNLDRATALYKEVRDADTGTSGDCIMTVSALNGLAAVAESKGELDQARQLYEQAAERVGDQFPSLAARALHRAATVGEYDRLVTIPETVPEAPSLDAITPPDGRPTTVEDLTNIINIPELPKPTLDPEPETGDEETPPPAPPTDTGDKDQDATP